MNFQHLQSVEKPQVFIDRAFKLAAEKSQKAGKNTYASKESKMKHQLLIRMDTISESLQKSMQHILESFPRIDDLSPFYVDLIKISLDYGDLKKSLGGVLWVQKTVSKITSFYKRKALKASPSQYNAIRTEFYGRIASVPNQIKKELAYIELCRKIMRKFPSIKTEMFTVCLYGFPNVGKSTLLSKLTPATPEIQSYAFTTKRLNLGYMRQPGRPIQFIDTPGTLDRAKLNPIEQQAELALKHLAHVVVFVYDPTYDFDKQRKLLKKLKGKEVLVYISKTDLVDEIVPISKHQTFDLESLKNELSKRAKQYYSTL